MTTFSSAKRTNAIRHQPSSDSGKFAIASQFAKRVVKLSISSAFVVCAGIADLFAQMVGKPRAATCVVLHYHGVRSGDRSRFAMQMDVLAGLATPIAANNRMPLEPGRRYAGLTFDDGFQNVIDNAVPELIARKIPATIFVVPSLLGGKPVWDTLGADYIRTEPLISAAQLKALPREIVTVGSHTITHAWLPSVPAAQAREEIFASRESLAHILDRDVELFSFPYGGCDDRLIELCREAGYSRVFTIMPRLAFRDPQEFVTGRIGVEPSDWPIEFRLKLLGAYRWLSPVINLKQKIVSILSLNNTLTRVPEQATECSPESGRHAQ